MKSNFLKFWKRTIISFTAKEEVLITLFLVLAIIFGIFSYKNITRTSFFNFLKNGGSYSEGIVGEIKMLNPVFVDLNPLDRDISILIFSGLTKYDAKQNTFVEDMAVHSLSADKKTYRFVIKDGIKWHDGSPLTVEDIYFTYHDVIQHPDFKNPILKANFDKIEVKIIDAKTIEFKLDNQNSFFYGNTIVGILPKHILKNVPVADLTKNGFNKMPIGTGPYKVVSQVSSLGESGTKVNLTKFNQFYSEKPHIKNINFTTYIDFKTLLKAKSILNGIPKILDEETLQNLRQDTRYTIYKYTLPRYTAAFFNMDSDILSDRKVRLALTKSVNKDELLAKLKNKRRIDTPLLELNQDDWLQKSNLKEANGSLYDAGWKYREAGDTVRKNSAGKKLTIHLLARKFFENAEKDVEVTTTIDFLKSAWEKTGFEVVVELVDDQTILNRIVKRDYDVLLYGHDLGCNLDTFSYWHSTQKGSKGLNLSNYSNPTADNLIESVRCLFDKEDDRKKLSKLGLLQEYINNDVPALFLYTPEYYYAVSSIIENVNISNLLYTSDRFSNIAEWEFE